LDLGFFMVPTLLPSGDLFGNELLAVDATA
jgi:hypothetical protein